MTRHHNRPSAPLGASLVVLSSVFYGSYGVWSVLMGSGFGNFTQAVVRSGLVVLILWAIAANRGALKPVQWRRDAKWLFYSALSSLLIGAPFYYAFQHAGVGLTNVLNYACLILSMFVFGRLFNKERFTGAKLVSCVLGLAGLYLVFTPNLHAAGLLALGAAVVSGLATGLNITASKNLPYGALQTTLIAWTGGLVTNLPLMWLTHEAPVPPLSDKHWLYLFCFVAISIAASWSVIQGVKLVEAGVAGILGLLEVVFGIGFGVVLFHEHPTAITLVGAGFILAAAAGPYLQHYNAARGRLE
ncbi:MAG TPA: DMT family transporter [Candidatus Saccharimonadia bacterium]|jgi:drug/metabolite transporter (DMT)-like permease|nr:DMT family transporter [Candidatus Saccharimonadia bacterium]